MQDLPAAAAQILVGRTPDGALLRESAADVVLGGGAPQRRARRPEHPFHPFVPQAHRPALLVGEQRREVLAVHAQVAVAPGDAQRRGRAGFHSGGLALFIQFLFRQLPGPGVGLVLLPARCLVRVPVAHLLHGGLFPPVRKQDAVGTEIVVAGPVAKIAAVAQHTPPQRVGAPEGLILEVPDKAALILGKLILQLDILLHAAQRVAHIVHVLTQQHGFRVGAAQILPDLLRGGVHPAFHVADILKRPVLEHPFVVHQAGVVLAAEEVGHGTDAGARIALVAARPEQDAGMILVPLKHRTGPVHHAALPLRKAARHIPLRINTAQLIPGTVALQVGFVHQVDARLVAQLVPQALVGVMAGAHRVDARVQHRPQVPAHILLVDGAALLGAPLMPVDAFQDQPFPVQHHDPVLDAKPPEAGTGRHRLLLFAGRVGQGQGHRIQAGIAVPPGPHRAQRQRAGLQGPVLAGGQGQRTVKQRLPLGRIHPALHPALGGVGHRALPHSAQLQPHPQAAGAVRLQRGAQPQIFQMQRRFRVQVHRPEQPREPEEILVLDPGGAAALVYLHTQAVAPLPDIGGQVKVRGGEAVLRVAHKLAVEPDVDGLLRALERDANPLAPQRLVQIKVPHVAAHRVVVPVDAGRTQLGHAVPGIDGIGIMYLAVALQFDMARHPDHAEVGQVVIFPPEVFRAVGGAGAPGKAPGPVQALPQILALVVPDMIGVSVQPVYLPDGGIFQPMEIGAHRIPPVGRRISAAGNLLGLLYHEAAGKG